MEAAASDPRSQHERVDWCVEATVRLLSKTDRREFSVMTKDLSRGGFCFLIRVYLQPGTLLEAEVPDGKGGTRRLQGVVRHCAVERAPMHSVGVQFMQPRQADQSSRA